ncbi:MAG: trypsin-like peptidase domain-containing protein [Proteobacteria bacterium]|nr:trypsin-like peptidase domain-containing protein [Pseudomonadota bacterium]
MPRLTGDDIESLSKLLTTRLNLHQLATIVYSSTGDQLYDAYVAPGKPLRPTIEDLLHALEREGYTELFLAAVYERSPQRPEIRARIAQLFPGAASPPGGGAGLSLQRAGSAQADAPAQAFAPGLQKNVRPHLAKLDVRIWLEKLAQIERRVCRVEYKGNAAGTGFLVGPDTVLTNWHVVETAKTTSTLGELACRFDYLRLADDTRQPGIAVGLHADGCLDSTPYSAAEKTNTPDSPPPRSDELDYALLRLAQPAGDAVIDGKRRGWIDMPAAPAPLDSGAPLLIVQHPDGAPMKLALDTNAVIGRNSGGTRIRYTTNTDPGSSGSPCFSMDWDLVALHHYGDPAWQDPVYNQGIPIELIRQRLVERGQTAALGANAA